MKTLSRLLQVLVLSTLSIAAAHAEQNAPASNPE
jgi:hypothetical protein